MSQRPKPSVDLGYPTPARGRIPAFNSIEEEAAWWDTHDAGDFWDEFEPVQVKVSPALISESAMSVRLPEATLERLRRQAVRKGMGHTTLARMWIMERLESEERSEPATS
jgi:hypothetical protein